MERDVDGLVVPDWATEQAKREQAGAAPETPRHNHPVDERFVVEGCPACPWPPGAAPETPRCPSCDDRRWVDDENWEPDDLRTWDGSRSPGDGLIPCGACNHGGWDVPVGAAPETPNACPHGHFGGYLCPECGDGAAPETPRCPHCSRTTPHQHGTIYIHAPGAAPETREPIPTVEHFDDLCAINPCAEHAP